MKNLWILCIFFGVLAVGQTPTTLTPTELEQAKLAKLKAQSEQLQTSLQQIDTQIQALTLLKQMTSERQQQKYSQYLGLAEEIKKHHDEWGDSSKIDFNPVAGESGAFQKKEQPKSK